MAARYGRRGLSIVADGLTAAQLPELSLPDISGIKQYPDQPALENHRAGDGIRGRRSQKVALIPGAEGVYRLPHGNRPFFCEMCNVKG